MPKGPNPGYEPGNHWVTCDRCGFAYRFSEMKKEWTGAVVCKADYEPRHPQDFVRGRKERITAQGFIRPEPSQESFVADPGFQDKSADLDYVVPEGTFDYS